MCYMNHRVFLATSHPWRLNKKSFDGKKELGSAPAVLEGTGIVQILKDFNNDFGKYRKNKKDGSWKKRSIFFGCPTSHKINYVIILM